MPNDPIKTAADYEKEIGALDAKLKKMEEDGRDGSKRYEELKAKFDLLQAQYDELKKKPAKPVPDAGDVDDEEEGDEVDGGDVDDWL